MSVYVKKTVFEHWLQSSLHLPNPEFSNTPTSKSNFFKNTAFCIKLCFKKTCTNCCGKKKITCREWNLKATVGYDLPTLACHAGADTEQHTAFFKDQITQIIICSKVRTSVKRRSLAGTHF